MSGNLNAEVKAYREHPFKGKLEYKKLSPIEAVIKDGDKGEVMRGMPVKVYWVFKAILEKMEREKKKK